MSENKIKNQHKVKSLKQQINNQMIWLGAILLLACSLLIFIFAIRSVNLTIDNLAILEARSIIHSANQYPNRPLPNDPALSAYKNWHAIPLALRQHFDALVITNGQTYEVKITAGESIDYLYLFKYSDEDFGDLFILSRYSETDIVDMFSSVFVVAIEQSLWLTIIIFIILFLLIRWLMKKISEPLAMLSEWAKALENNPDKLHVYNYPIKEVNQLACQLQKSIEQVKEYNVRESEFLKHASHEFRTPLAIIQASLDTLNLKSDDINKKTVARALKASENMNQLSTSILWLAKDSINPIEKTTVDVGILCSQIIDNLKYLLVNQNINTELNINTETLLIEKDLFSILMTNLIRNAFQYSSSGLIEINVTENEFCITNPFIENDHVSHANTVTGFGLGLQLVERICHQIGWKFNYFNNTKSVKAMISWK